MPAEPSGVLVVRKHSGVTSHDIVNAIRRLYGTRRVGHTGTLDPMATGVLVVLVGRAAKAAEYLTTDCKRYRAVLRLGLTTDTEDCTGKVLTECKTIPDEAQLEAVLPHFRGSIEQIPPMYSALKVNGQKLLDLARRGETIERTPRTIQIFELTATPTQRRDEYILDVACSGGTYIRTLCADIGASLGYGGAMAELERTETGGFSLSDAHSVAEIENLSQESRLSLLIPIERLFSSLPAVSLPPFFERLFRNGCPIYLKKIRIEMPTGQRVQIRTEDGTFFALGEVCDTDEGQAIRSIKTFVL